ncbi:MAG TPA: magnesium transporter [Vicinamibacterales bacterium]|nr:magnesium transporter [Vicinamibacterales bacterium]
MPRRFTTPRKSLRVVIGTVPVPLAGLFSVEQGLAILLLGTTAMGLFAAGIVDQTWGAAGPWFLTVAVLIGWAVRAVDLENAALFIPGGLYGAAKRAFGPPTARAAAAVILADSLLFSALSASAAGHALIAVGSLVKPAAAAQRENISLADITVALAACLVGIVWLRLRQGRPLPATLVRRTVTPVAAGLIVLVTAHAIELLLRRGATPTIAFPSLASGTSLIGILFAIGGCLFVVGSGDAVSHASADFPPPKVRNLRRAMWFVNAYALIVIAGGGFVFAMLVPATDRLWWHEAPMAALPWFDGTPRWIGLLSAIAIAAASVLLFGLAIHRAAIDAHKLLLRLAEDGVLLRAMRALHPRFGTPARLIDLGAIAQTTVVIVSGGRLAWIARAYAIVLACGLLLKVAALIRLRTLRSEPRAFRVGFNPRLGGRERPVGLVGVGLLVGVPALLLVVSGDLPALGGGALLAVALAALTISERMARQAAADAAEAAADVELLAMPAIGVDQIHPRPGNVLVPVRKPGALAHLATALQNAGDRDLIVVSVRLAGIDASDDVVTTTAPTDEERRVLTDAAMLAERAGRAVRLLIVPGVNVFDSIAATIAKLGSSEVYVGESETLTGADQVRLLGEAWERIPPPKPLGVRLVVRHGSGRTAEYHLGAHAPALTADDLQMIHDLWLQMVKTVGPHVHHHDVVRAALTHMQEDLKHPDRAGDAIDVVRKVARPGDELAAAVRQRDFVRLRDMVRNRPPSDLAAALTDLAPEDQVVAFRVLPRRVAAATFEYLSLDAQETLLKAMALDDVAAILNEMAPDDRTMFLEELPATATQQLLTLLTPDERAVALTLLGYPEGSIGRLMTPDYIAVREQWTIHQVLDHIRGHGQDSETLNVIYVVDDRGMLIDDIRIRELLLTSPENHVSDLMDRRFVALNAADDQNTAVTVFRREDRTALPVTDTTGVLIGIVTIDDVLDVVEAVTTKEIQRIGGSEALDEPYMEIAFRRMIQKRAGWLTALFLGEMLTATAMGAFEREIERAVVLALFVPLIISSGGNSGSQASTLVIRAIALGEVQLRDWWQVMRREIGAGLTLGGILGSIGFLRITVWSLFSNLYGPHWLLVALTVGLALVGVVLWGTLIGSLLPFLLRRFGFDPATSSAPFVATLVDVTGLIIYFTVGIVVLRGTLL